MALNVSTFWHKESFDRLLNDRLPQLLADRLPLAGYHAESTGPYTCRVRVALSSASGDVEIEYSDIPQPDEEGIFEIAGRRLVVMPLASQDELDIAEIRCVGEQVYDYIRDRLGEAPGDLPWDEALVKAWLPLETWIKNFMQRRLEDPVYPLTHNTVLDLDETNWLSRCNTLRRLCLPGHKRGFTPGHFGRVCPLETPEGPNIGRILTIAVGAEIRDGKLVIANDNPEATLGIGASMVPFLEYSDTNRLLMGVNMMRQWIMPPDPEPALVQTGNEPDAAGFWCGRSLLTAYVSWGMDTFEDGIVISESCAKRLNYPNPIEPGDKLSNRHGTKGVVSRILPDDEMPHLADGTPVEIVFDFIAVHTRLNFGQTREAIMGRIARTEGKPAIVPPFRAPGERELRERLAKAGLPEDAMEILTLGRAGKKLARPSLVGYVYWGKLWHLAEVKIHTATGPGPVRCQQQSEMEYYALRDAGAFATIAEHFNTRAAERPDADTLAARVAAGKVEQAGPPSPKFSEMVRRLASAGIRADFDGEKLSFRFAAPEAPVLRLACPVSHPWLHGREITEVGILKELPEYGKLVEANARMERMMVDQAPESLKQKAFADLQIRIRAFLDQVLTPDHLQFGGRILFSGRTVIAPGKGLRIDQVGLAEEIAWTLFSPLVMRELGDEEEVKARTNRATQALDEIMARSWVILHRAPTQTPWGFVAFHPVRDPGRVIRLHPSVCYLMNADYDGDQIAVFLPVTEEGQREAGERLSVAGYLTHDPAAAERPSATGYPVRDPGISYGLYGWHAGKWGLAHLSLLPEGRQEIEEIIGASVAAPDGFLTKNALAQAMHDLLEREGIEKFFRKLDQLMERGFQVAKESGASISPFIGATLQRPPEPPTADLEAWNRFAEEIAEQLASRNDFSDNDLGPQLLAAKSGARGSLNHLLKLAGLFGIVIDIDHRPTFVVRHGCRHGLTFDEMMHCVIGAREGLIRVNQEMPLLARSTRAQSESKGFNVLARAMRARRPGIVFARAAATGEIDPLLDLDSRLFVGLPVKERG